jgi:hypothetical protein
VDDRTSSIASEDVVKTIGEFLIPIANQKPHGRLGFDKVIPLSHKSCEAFSNLSGINELQYDSDDWSTVFMKIRGVAEREGLVPRRA